MTGSRACVTRSARLATVRRGLASWTRRSSARRYFAVPERPEASDGEGGDIDIQPLMWGLFAHSSRWRLPAGLETAALAAIMLACPARADAPPTSMSGRLPGDAPAMNDTTTTPRVKPAVKT